MKGLPGVTYAPRLQNTEHRGWKTKLPGKGKTNSCNRSQAATESRKKKKKNDHYIGERPKEGKIMEGEKGPSSIYEGG